MYANARIENGGNIHSVVLLGPTFDASDEASVRQIGFEKWSPYIDKIVENGVNVLVVNDYGEGGDVPESYSAPKGGGNFVYWNEATTATHHYRTDGTGVNDSSDFVERIYSWDGFLP